MERWPFPKRGSFPSILRGSLGLCDQRSLVGKGGRGKVEGGIGGSKTCRVKLVIKNRYTR